MPYNPGIATQRPVKDIAGSLSEYAKNVKSGIPMKHLKEKAWEKAVREKKTNKSSRHRQPIVMRP